MTGIFGGKGLKGGRGYASMNGGSGGYAKLGFSTIGQEGMNHGDHADGFLPEPMVNVTHTQGGGRRRRGTKRRCTTKRSGSKRRGTTKRRGSKRRGTTKRRKTHKRKH